jgi:hypothetical protein
MFVQLLGTSQSNELGKTFVIAVGPGNPFPQLPRDGVSSEADLAGVPGLKTREGAVSPGPDGSLYTFSKQNVHRNLYRIPTP